MLLLSSYQLSNVVANAPLCWFYCCR